MDCLARKLSKVTLSFLLIIFFVMGGCAAGLFAQATENTAAGAKIVSALSLEEESPLHFGAMTIPTAAVAVIVTTDGSRSQSNAGITLLSQSPGHSPASYDVFGSADATYAITVPATITITHVGLPTESMTIDNLVVESLEAGQGLTGKLDETGIDSFVIGASLELDIGQTAGVYHGTFDVSVAYN